MPASTTTRRANDSSHNKFKATDMPEIRHVRSTLLKSLKLIKKTSRLDRITKAIVHDIDWLKLSINVNSTDQDAQDRIEHLNSAIITFRSQLAEELEEIMHDISTNAEHQARTSASTPGIFEAASTMAHKYHARENNKSSARPRPHKHSTTSTKPTQSPRPADPSTKSTQGPRRHSTNMPNNSTQRSTTTSQRPRLNKPPTKARKTKPASAQSTPTSTRSTPSTSTTNTSRCTRSTTKKNTKPQPAPPTVEEQRRLDNAHNWTSEDDAWFDASRFASRSSDNVSDSDLE